MKHKKKLFSIDNVNIRVMINLGFDGEDLKLDGYDIGKSVSDMWGDSDYEYSITVSEGELPRLYELNQVPFGNKKKLISVLAKFLSDNKAFTLFHDYLKENNIPFTCFSY
jgi:hypothetical protein